MNETAVGLSTSPEPLLTESSGKPPNPSPSSVRWDPQSDACVSGCVKIGGGDPERTSHGRYYVLPPSDFFCSSNSGPMCLGFPWQMTAGEEAFPCFPDPTARVRSPPPSILNPTCFHLHLHFRDMGSKY